MTYAPMDFRAGAVVLHTPQYNAETRIGHVVGFTRNSMGEVILEVRWDNGEILPIHPALVTLDPADWPLPWSEEKCLERIHQNAEQTGIDKTSKRGLLSRLFG